MKRIVRMSTAQGGKRVGPDNRRMQKNAFKKRGIKK